MPPATKTALRWLLLFLGIAFGVFVAVVPAEHRIRVVVAFVLLTPFAIGTLFFVLHEP